MNKRQSNKVNAYRKVKGVLDKYAKLFRDLEIYALALDKFNALLADLEQVTKRTELDTTGETKRKQDLKEQLASKTFALASSGLMYAYDSGNTELKAALGYSPSDIRNARYNDASRIAMAVEHELNQHTEALQAYKVSDQDLQEFHELIEDFTNSTETQGEVKSDSVADTRLTEILINGIDELLEEKLDRMVQREAMDNPRVFDAYQSARVIVDL